MIIRPKLRPKELKEFDMYFGNLRAVAKKNLDKEELENLKFSAMYSKRIYAVMHNNEKSMERARNLWDNIKQILYGEMNELQKEIYEEYNLLTRIGIAVLGKPLKIATEEREVAKVHTIDVILDALDNTSFLKKVLNEEKNKNFQVPEIYLPDINGGEAFIVDFESDLSKIILPDKILSNIKEVSGKYEERMVHRVIYYILIILDILERGLESASLPWVILEDVSLKDVLYNNIFKSLTKERVTFWKALANAKNFLYEPKIFSTKSIHRIEQSIAEIKTECSSEQLIAENYYFNLAQAIVLSDEEFIAVYFNLSKKEERNAVINEAVVMARKLKSLIIQKIEFLDLDSLYKAPWEYEDLLNEICWLFQTFRLIRPIMVNEMERKGVNEDWKFMESLFLLKLKEIDSDNLEKAYKQSEEKIKGLAMEEILKSLMDDLKVVAGGIEKADTKVEALAALRHGLWRENDDEEIARICEKAMEDYKENIKMELRKYSLNNLSSKNADFSKINKVLEALDNNYISREEFVESQRNIGTKEKYIRLFAFFYSADFIV